MTLAVLLTGSPSMAHGRGRQGGRAVPAVKNSTSTQLSSLRLARLER